MQPVDEARRVEPGDVVHRLVPHIRLEGVPEATGAGETDDPAARVARHVRVEQLVRIRGRHGVQELDVLPIRDLGR